MYVNTLELDTVRLSYFSMAACEKMLFSGNSEKNVDRSWVSNIFHVDLK